MSEHTDSCQDGDSGALRLLLADDDPVVRATLAAQLGRRHHLVGVARDAEEAIAIAVEQRPDLAILDVQMPAGGGLRAAREIKAAVPSTTIVALSADESDAVVVEMLMAGAVAYLRKGASSTELDEALTRSVRAHHQLRLAPA